MPVCMAVRSTSDQIPPPPGPPLPPPGMPLFSDPSVTGRPSSSRGCRCPAQPARTDRHPKIIMKRDRKRATYFDPPIWILDTSTSSCVSPACVCGPAFPPRGMGGGPQRLADWSISGGGPLCPPNPPSGGPSPPMPRPIMPPASPFPPIMPAIPPPGPKPPPNPSDRPPWIPRPRPDCMPDGGPRRQEASVS